MEELILHESSEKDFLETRIDSLFGIVKDLSKETDPASMFNLLEKLEGVVMRFEQQKKRNEERLGYNHPKNRKNS